MLPGYIDECYFSPIKVNRIIPKKSGDSMLRLGFYNAAYAAGAQNFVLELKVMVRAETYTVSALQYAGISADKVRLLGRPENRHRPTKWRKVASHAYSTHNWFRACRSNRPHPWCVPGIAPQMSSW